jgi:DNA-binding MarR family transcriptional regulator
VKTALTGPRLSALSVIVFSGPLTLGELAAAEQVRPPTMTRLVTALERAGLVRRESDADDRRVVRLRATARGEQLLLAGRSRRVKRLASPIAELTAAERKTLADAADILASVIARLS